MKKQDFGPVIEFSMIVQSLKESLPEEAKEELRPIFEISITEDSGEQMVREKLERGYMKRYAKGSDRFNSFKNGGRTEYTHTICPK